MAKSYRHSYRHGVLVLALSLAVGGCKFFGPREDGGIVLPPDPGQVEQKAASLEPVEQDSKVYIAVYGMEKAGRVNEDTVARLTTLVGKCSQVMGAAVSPELFRLAVLIGSPSLLQVACNAQARVSDLELRTTGSGLASVKTACAKVALGERMSSQYPNPCVRSVHLLHQAYSLLAGGMQKKALKVASKGLRARANCKSAKPMIPTPVDPRSQKQRAAFVMVSLFQALDVDPYLYIGNQTVKPAIAAKVKHLFNANKKTISNRNKETL